MRTSKYIVWLLTFVLTTGATVEILSQPFVKLDIGSDNSMHLMFHDPAIKEKPEKIVFIFENTTVTCNISDSLIIAMVTHGRSSNPAENYQGNTPSLKQDMEEPLILEDWMLRPDEWIR